MPFDQKCTYENVAKKFGRALPPPPHLDKIQKNSSFFSGNLPLPQKALSNVICKFLHIHAIVLNLIHRPVLVLTWGNFSNRKKHWASMSRGVAFDVILHFCSEATSETPDVCRPLVEVANKC